MVTRFTTTGEGAAVEDPGRTNSQHAMERGATRKWLDGMKADTDKEVTAAMRKVK